MQFMKYAALLCVSLSLSSCTKVQEAFIEYQVRDKTDHSLVEDKEGIRVILCGTGTPQVNSPRGQACTLVAAGGKLFLFDAGENAMRNVETNHVPSGAISRVFITHWHSDHFNGLGGLINHSWVNGRTEPLMVYGPLGVERVVKGLAMAYADDTRFRSTHFVPNPDLAFAEAHRIVFNREKNSVRVYEQDGVSIDAYRVDHRPVDPALGYLLSYRGKKVFISGDTRVTDLYLPAIQNADLVVHEAINSSLIHQAADAMRRLDRPVEAARAEKVIEYHADTLELARLSQKARVKHLVLTHLIPSPPNFIAKRLFISGMADEYQGKITLGEDAMDIRL